MPPEELAFQVIPQGAGAIEIGERQLGEFRELAVQRFTGAASSMR